MIMDAFYILMDQMLDHDRRCPNCNDRMWIVYGGGHVWDKCMNSCPEIQTLDIAGYITGYPVPQEPLPENFEIKDVDYPYEHGSHEYKAYRKVVIA